MKLKNKRVILNVIFIYKTHILYQGVIIMNHYNCIYMYINKINGHSYIGQAKNFNKRHREHICKTNHKYPIDRAFNKYGKDNFKVIILKENLESQCLLNFWECYFIDKYNTLNNGNYNLSSGGSNGNNFTNKTKEEMEQFKRNMSEIKKGTIMEEETKQQISKTMKERYSENHWMNGRTLSEETKKKISDSQKGRQQTEETKIKISNAHKGKTLTTNHKEKLSKAKDNKKQKIVSIDIDTGYVEFFSCIMDVKRKYNYNPSLVRQCCLYNNNKEEFVEKFGRSRKSAYNKNWFYLYDYEKRT